MKGVKNNGLYDVTLAWLSSLFPVPFEPPATLTFSSLASLSPIQFRPQQAGLPFHLATSVTHQNSKWTWLSQCWSSVPLSLPSHNTSLCVNYVCRDCLLQFVMNFLRAGVLLEIFPPDITLKHANLLPFEHPSRTIMSESTSSVLPCNQWCAGKCSTTSFLKRRGEKMEPSFAAFANFCGLPVTL